MKVTTTKYASALFLTAALSLAGAQAVPQATQAADPTLAAANITIETGKYQGPLSSLLGAIAKGAGYELVLEVNVDNLSEEEGSTPVAYSFQDKPFNEVWPLLMDIYDLNYTVTNLGDQPVIRVNKEAVQQVVKLETIEADYAVQRTKVFFGSPTEAKSSTASDGDTQQANATVASTGSYQFDSPTLRVVADKVANRVIIRGTNTEVQEVATFIIGLDASATEQRAEQLANYEEEAEIREEIYRSNGDSAQIAEFIASQYPALTVRQLPNNSGLILSGNGTVLDSALTLLAKTDPASDGTVQEVFQLVNANATEVAETLTNTLARQLTRAGAESDKDSLFGGVNEAVVGLAEREVTIIPDQRTNTLIVRGTTGQVAQVASLIPTLDQRVPQINLQVRIQEINLDSTNTLGVDWRASAGGFQVGLLGSKGLSASFNPLQSSIGFNIFPVLTALENKNLSKRVYDAAITMQSGQRSLEAGIGSKDASSKAAATIRSGGRLEINIPGPTNGENIEKTIPYGVVLDFFDPVVAPDGTITVRVKGQINTIRNAGAIEQAIASGVPPYLLDFLNSEAQTKISLKPGETVLLTGLSKIDESNQKTGLPLSTQIPFLGALTGSQTTTKDNTDMLFVITADIVE